MYKSHFNKGFTLAEVLVTIMVIGILADMTVPSLIKNYEENVCKIAWKKTFSDLSQATSVLAVNGQIPATSVTTVINAYGNELSTIKKCATLESGCFHEANDYYTFKGSNIALGTWYFRGGYILKNGSLITFVNLLSSPPEPNPAIPGSTLIIYVDVNGFKKPNTLGRDIFAAYPTAERLVPVSVGHPASSYDCDNTSFSLMSGLGCSALVLTGEDY